MELDGGDSEFFDHAMERVAERTIEALARLDSETLQLLAQQCEETFSLHRGEPAPEADRTRLRSRLRLLERLLSYSRINLSVLRRCSAEQAITPQRAFRWAKDGDTVWPL